MSQPKLRSVIPFRTRNRYPVSCPTHGDFCYGYTVCLCIAKSIAEVHSVIPPSNAHLGEITCGRREKHRPEEFVLMDEGCVREKGLDRKGGEGGVSDLSAFEGPFDGERVLFCGHVSVSEFHLSIKGPHHWYHAGDNEAQDKRTGETFRFRWICVCGGCHSSLLKMNSTEASMFAKQDAPWIGEPPQIARMV